ncbi:trimeric intracellular cation channel family protein [Nitratiruptor sp. YY09-18]|uniref:trimeric intracellular cation channel family protein n=1 Tax=Nitratiruptor sp. YY09-18 TaxID=2724901 RepID=UPI0019169CD9|nr:TRIC cation channel family protein [Nitratiruptor sp. YY09-18]BCD68298.1 hypothetical protein NitYY0918_C1209 [Nitratiruptor sp. YY09-18]
MHLLHIADIVGIIAFALSGYWVAAAHKLDFLGAFILAFLTALGGGVVRDVIVGKIPDALTSNIPALLVLAVVFIAYFMKLHRFFDYQKKHVFILSDTIGLGSFSISGALAALQYELGFFGTLLLALTTAVGGGILRDILLNEVPFILKTGFYGTVALIVGAIVYLLDHFGFINLFTLFLLLLFAIFLRLMAIRRNWRLPKL